MRSICNIGLITLICLFTNLADAKGEEQSQAVKLEQLPPAVQKTLLAESGDGKGKLGDIEKTTEEDGEIRYDATLTKGKEKRSFSVAPDGKLVSRQVFLREIPPPARKTIHEQSTKAKLGDIDRVVEDGKVIFEVTMTKDEREINFSVARDGRLLTMEIGLAEAPEKVQAAIKKQAAGATLKSIEKNTEDEGGEVAYDVEAMKDGKKISFSIDADGNLMDD